MKKWTLEGAIKKLAQLEANDRASDISGTFYLGRVGFRKPTKRYRQLIDKGIDNAILMGKLHQFIKREEARLWRLTNTPQPVIKSARVVEKKTRWSTLPAEGKYQLGFGYLGNGLSVWNSAREIKGDYESIAHISNDGKTVTFRKQDLPKAVTERIEEEARKMAHKHAVMLQTEADYALCRKHFFLAQGYAKEQIIRAYGAFDETDLTAYQQATDRIEAAKIQP